jgi:hypothetical protein
VTERYPAMRVEPRTYDRFGNVTHTLSPEPEWATPSPVYGHGSDWERDEMWLAYYRTQEAKRAARLGTPARMRTLAEWRGQ